MLHSLLKFFNPFWDHINLSTYCCHDWMCPPAKHESWSYGFASILLLSYAFAVIYENLFIFYMWKFSYTVPSCNSSCKDCIISLTSNLKSQIVKHVHSAFITCYCYGYISVPCLKISLYSLPMYFSSVLFTFSLYIVFVLKCFVLLPKMPKVYLLV